MHVGVLSSLVAHVSAESSQQFCSTSVKQSCYLERDFREFKLGESNRMRVAFLGMGIMGRPMAANLVKAGHEVAVWNRTPGKGVEGARAAASPADAAQGAEVIWMCVSDTNVVEGLLFGPGGVEASLA